MNVSRQARAERAKNKATEAHLATAGVQVADLPDHPAKRFLVGFVVCSPLTWLACVGYGYSSGWSAVGAALIVGALLGILSATGKWMLQFILNLISHGGI